MKRSALFATATVVALQGAVTSGPATADPVVQVHSAYDLFQTASGGTHYGPIHFSGVKGCAQFPDATNTDTVVQRLQTATPASPHTDIEALCLQLQGEFLDPQGASEPVDAIVGDQVTIGAVTLPVKAVFATLQSDRGRNPTDAAREAVAPGKPSVGGVDFTFDQSGCGGAFDSDLKVYFDLRAGSINGPIIYSADDQSAPFFHSYGTPWGCSAALSDGGFEDKAYTVCDDISESCLLKDIHRVIAPSDLLEGVNFHLDGLSSAQDFFPMQVFS